MRSSGYAPWLLAPLALLVLSAAPSGAEAQRRGRVRPEVQEGVTLLASESQDEVRGGLEALGLLGDPTAVGPIAERIQRGLPPDLLEVALDTLMILGRPEAGPVLFQMMSHRRPNIRAKAVQAIVATRPRGADGALIAALSDTDPTVRSAAAEGLGTLGAVSGLDPLFHALDRSVPEAALAIAQIARPAEVERFLGYLGRAPFDSMTPALSEMLLRADLAARAKLAIIHRLTELATPEVRQFLIDFVAALEPSSEPQVRRAAEDAIPRIGQ